MRVFITVLFLSAFAGPLSAELSVHPIFSDHLVLQRDKPVAIFGSAAAGAKVEITFGDQTVAAEADDAGAWTAMLEPMKANSESQTLTVKSGDDTHVARNVLVGEVWVMGGQSNMEHELGSIYDGDLEMASANYPNIRFLTVPKVVGPDRLTRFEPVDEFNAWTNSHEKKGWWAPCDPESLKKFAGIGYIFGKRIHVLTRVPVGLIDVSVGGTTVETWTSRESLEAIDDAKMLVEMWDQKVKAWDGEADLAQRIKNWERNSTERKKRGEKPGKKPEPRPGPSVDQNRPGNCYNGMLATLDGLIINGVVFNQGYNNAGGDSRPALYAKTIQAMIGDWQQIFRDEKLPFGIIGMTPGGDPQTLDNFEKSILDPTPWIREAQNRAAKDIEGVAYFPSWDQQMKFYHPFKKIPLGERSARWALSETMNAGRKFPWQVAELKSYEIEGDKFIVKFTQPVQSHDGRPFEGFAIAGKDQRFYPATAEWLVTGKDKHNRDQHDRTRVIVSSPHVPNPVAIRHAWARNPLGNLTQGEHHLRNVPVACFRTDDWAYPEAPFADSHSPEMYEHRRAMGELRRQAEKSAANRKLADAKLILEAAEPQAGGEAAAR